MICVLRRLVRQRYQVLFAWTLVYMAPGSVSRVKYQVDLPFTSSLLACLPVACLTQSVMTSRFGILNQPLALAEARTVIDKNKIVNIPLLSGSQHSIANSNSHIYLKYR